MFSLSRNWSFVIAMFTKTFEHTTTLVTDEYAQPEVTETLTSTEKEDNNVSDGVEAEIQGKVLMNQKMLPTESTPIV